MAAIAKPLLPKYPTIIKQIAGPTLPANNFRNILNIVSQIHYQW